MNNLSSRVSFCFVVISKTCFQRKLITTHPREFEQRPEVTATTNSLHYFATRAFQLQFDQNDSGCPLVCVVNITVYTTILNGVVIGNKRQWSKSICPESLESAKNSRIQYKRVWHVQKCLRWVSCEYCLRNHCLFWNTRCSSLSFHWFYLQLYCISLAIDQEQKNYLQNRFTRRPN